MKSLIYKYFKGILLVSLMTTATCFAQFSGGVQGTVQDTSAAAVPKAVIILTNSDTNVSQQATTDDAGVYRFVSLAPGPYVLSASVPGFATAKISFVLTTAETRNVPIKLTIGQ